MFTAQDILNATGGNLAVGSLDCVARGISTDSRTIEKGELFIALEGDNFNGHEFVTDSVQRGAVGVVVKAGVFSYKPVLSMGYPVFLIEVNDTLKALGDIAYFYRKRFNIPVAGVTGSNGKTTTKDMIAHILSLSLRVLKNQGTLNNFIGMPLTLLKLADQHQACVLEMGANHLGEIARLSEIAVPDIGVITNIGPSHLEFLKDLETVSQAKTELFQNFKPDDTAIWNADDAMLSGLYQTHKCRKKTFGFSAGCDYQATHIEYLKAEGAWRFALNSNKLIKIKLLGRHNIYNALAAIAVSDTMGIDYESIFSGLSSFGSVSMRMEILEAAGITIINDSYNSNPKSMESAIAVLSDFNASGRKILVSGDMLELGDMSDYYHHQLGLSVGNSNTDIFIAVGPRSREAAASAISSGMNKSCVYLCDNSKQAGEALIKILRQYDVVLIKGSCAMKMENICSTIYSTR